MAMVVKNGLEALNTLNTLNKNSKDMGKALQRVSSGVKINSAADDAAGYSISESMRVQMRALNQCNVNTRTGQNLLDIAEGAVDNQIEILRGLKEIALDSANDTNTDSDRAIMQKEVNSRLMEMNDISYGTTYNNRQLLCGMVPGIQVTSFDSSGDPVQNTTPIITETPQTTQNCSYTTISVYDSGTYLTTVYDASNPKYTPRSTQPNSGSTIYISNNGSTYTQYTVQPSDTFTLNSNNTYSITTSTGTYATYTGSYSTIASSKLSSGSQYALQSQMPTQVYSYTLTTLPDGQQIVDTTGTRNGYSYYDINLLGSNLPTSLDKQGFSMICNAGCGQFISIQFDASMPANTASHYPDANNKDRECYVVGISGLTALNDIYDSMEQGISKVFKQTATNPAGTNTNTYQISTFSHTVTLNFYTDASGNKHCYADKKGGEMHMYDGNLGEIKTVGGTIPKSEIVIQGDTTSSSFTKLQLPNTTLNVLFPSADSILDIEPTEDDYPNPWPTEYDGLTDEEKKTKFRDEVWPYPKKGASATATCVSTQDKALKFVDDLDQAIKYLTNAATTLGVQHTRLSYMNDNIVTSTENTTSAESVMRDADMAKEMTSYTKYNVLSQSAQSMLSQANQNLGSTLDLLQ